MIINVEKIQRSIRGIAWKNVSGEAWQDVFETVWRPVRDQVWGELWIDFDDLKW